MFLLLNKALRIYTLFSCLLILVSCSKKEREEREADAILSQQLLALQDELKTASVHCQSMLTQLSPFEQVSLKIRSCLATSAEGPFVIQLKAYLQTSRIEIESIKGVEPLLDASLQKKCIEDMIMAQRSSTRLQEELNLEAKSSKPMWPTYQLEVSRTQQNGLQHKELVSCTHLSDPIQTHIQAMTEIREQPFNVDSSVFDDPINQSLKSCDQHLDEELQAKPSLFSFAIVGRSEQKEDEHVCVSFTGGKLEAAGQCLCDHLRLHRAKLSIRMLPIQVTAPDGRRLTTSSSSGTIPVKQTAWIARIPTAEGPHFYSVYSQMD